MEFRIRKKTAAGGVILTEIIVSLGIIALYSASALWGLSMLNNQAAVARLYTGAQVVAQNQIDLCLSDSPFNPQKNQIPPELTVGTTVTNNVPLYIDPLSNQVVNTGTMTTVVTNTGSTLNGYNLNLYSITVTVSWTYRGRSFNLKMSTMRASDV